MEFTGPGPWRRWWCSALVVLGALAMVGVLSSCADKHTPVPAACGVTPTAHTGVTAPVAAPSGGLRVVEKGFTQLGDGGATVSLGATVENTSTLVAYRTRVTIRVLDARQQSVVAAHSGEFLNQEIPVILPGQRIGVGAWTYVRDGTPGTKATVSGFEVDLGTPQWWPRDNDVHSFAPISASQQGTARNATEPESGTISYSVDSGYCRELAPRGVAVLFRNSADVLVGGSFELDRLRRRCQPAKFTDSVAAFQSIPPGIDDRRTGIYPYCDPDPAGGSPGPSGPVN